MGRSWRRTFLETAAMAMAALLMVMLPGCGWLFRAEAPTPRALPPAPAPRLEVFPKSADLSDVIRLTYQADQIAREAWWVLAQERRSSGRSPFGKALRAATLKHDGKLSGKGLFDCDRYDTREDMAPGGRKRFSFAETCRPKEGRKEFAVWTFLEERRAEVEFQPANLGEVLGLGAGIFGRRIRCELRWNERRVLDQMSCSGWEQDREPHRIRLSVFEYRREGGALLKLKGEVVDGLEVVRKIESEVPLEGKIVVTEVLTKAPAEPAAPAPVAPAPAPPWSAQQEAAEGRDPGAPTVDGPPLRAAPPRFKPAKPPMDPDLMRRQFKPEEGEVPEDGEPVAEDGEAVEGEATEEGPPEEGGVAEESLPEGPGGGFVAPTGEPDYIPEGDLQTPVRSDDGGSHQNVREGSQANPPPESGREGP